MPFTTTNNNNNASSSSQPKSKLNTLRKLLQSPSQRRAAEEARLLSQVFNDLEALAQLLEQSQEQKQKQKPQEHPTNARRREHDEWMRQRFVMTADAGEDAAGEGGRKRVERSGAGLGGCRGRVLGRYLCR